VKEGRALATDALLRARLQAICGDRGLAQLGDAFVNLVYSLAKSRHLGTPVGEKVPDRVLSEALGMSGLPAPARLKCGERGNIVEAALAQAWIGGMMTIDEAADAVLQELSRMRFRSAALEREAAARAFSTLLKSAVPKIEAAEGQ